MRHAWILPLLSALVASRARTAMAQEVVTAMGPTGLLQLPSARTAPVGTMQGGVFVDVFAQSGFLCTAARPCAGVTRDTHRHTGATAALNAVPFPGLEVYLVGRTYVNDNSAAPEVLQVIGDTTMGAKYARRLGSVLSIGGTLDVLFGGASGTAGYAFSGTSARLRALATFTVPRGALHLGLGYVFDNSGALVRDVEDARGRPISRVERQGLGIQRSDRLELSAGSEIGHFRIRPIIEFTLGIPVARQGYRCEGTDDPCFSDAGAAALPAKFMVGARWVPFLDERSTPWLLLAFEGGLGGRRTFAYELSPQPLYTVWLGIGLSLGTADPPPRILLQKVDVPTPMPSVTIRGTVHVAGGQAPIADAIVRYVGVKRGQLSTDADGHFADEVTPGTYELRVRAPGFAENVCGGTAIAVKGKTNVLTLDCPLEPLLPVTAPPPAAAP